MTPLQIKVKEKKILYILWSDKTESEIKLTNLRRNCPCAVCSSEQQSRSSTYIPIYTANEITIKKIQVMGSYAIEVTWQDDHNTGIYDFTYLKQLSEMNSN